MARWNSMGYVEQVGFGEITERGVRAAELLPRDTVYVGFSLGVLPAQKLAQTRAGARGALLFHACIPISEFGAAWPDRVPVQVQVHAKQGLNPEPAHTARSTADAAPGTRPWSLGATRAARTPTPCRRSRRARPSGAPPRARPATD